jgi:hypothetical protein
MKRILLIIICGVALGLNAQERLFFADKLYESVTTDLQGNVFLSMGSTLDSYTADGIKLLNYSDPTWGNISQVDAGIASKILVFYQESGTILLLNNELSPINGPLSLFDKGLMTVSLAAMGNPNKIVLYDEANQDLIITDLSLNMLSQTHITFPGEFHPTDMQVVPEHRIALLDTLNGICLFDFFGTFEKMIPIPEVQAMQFMKDQIIYLKDNTLYRYRIPTESSPMYIETIDIKIPNITQFRFFQDKLYYIDDNDHPMWFKQ